MPEEKRWRIIFYYKEDHLPLAKIARKVGVDRHSVADIIEKYRETKTVHDRPHPGRKRKMSDSDVKIAIRMAKKKKLLLR